MIKIKKRLLPALAILAIIATMTYGQDNERYTQGQVSDSATLSLGVPLFSYKGRGINLPISLSYSSSVWRLDHLNKRYNSGTATYHNVTEAIFAEHSKAGWKSSLDLPRIEFPKLDEVYNFNGLVSGNCRMLRVARVTIHMPDGATYQLRKSDLPHNLGYVDKAGTFYAVDGSRVRYDSTDEDTGTLYLPDGTRYVLDNGSGQIIDRHGNTLSYNGGTRTWTDTLGRQIVNPLPTTPAVGETEYTLPGLSGVNGGEQTYKFKWALLGNALTNSQDPLRYVASHYITGTTDFPLAQNSNAESMFYSVVGFDIEEGQPHPYMTMVVGKGQSPNTTFNPVVLTEITLPDDSKYKFSYNVYGEIDKVIYPPGGFEQYEYESPTVDTTDEGVKSKQPYVQAERRIKTRGVSENGTGSDLIESDYAFDYDEGKTTVTAPDGTKTETYKFVGPWEASQQHYGFESIAAGMVYERRVLSDTNVLLRRELTKYEHTSSQGQISGTCPNGYNYSPTVTALRNLRVQKTTTLTFESGSSSALAQVSIFGYDTTYQSTTGVDQSLVQTHHFTSLSNSNAASYTIDQISAGSLASQTETTYSTNSTYRETKHILGLPTVVKVKDGSGTTVVSQSEMSYDDSGYVPTSSTNAMPTTMRTWDSTKGAATNSSAYLVTHATFDQWGNRTIATDAKGYQTTTAFGSTYINNQTTYGVYPVSVTSEVPDPTPNGTPHGSSSAFTTSTNFDPITGLVLSATDINNQTTYMEYEDDLLRPTKVTAPNGHQTITEYGAGTSESTRWVKVKSQITANQWTEAKSLYDGLGRTYRTQKTDTSDPDGDSHTITCYDIMGRVEKTSSPFRNYTNQTCSTNTLDWTVPQYDDLSRTEKVTMPSPSPAGTPGSVTITYGISTETGAVGTTKTITDEAGKQRKGITDGLGNMVRVIEDPNGLNLTTDYLFDTLGNLRKTTQGDQIRYFSYDSLGRVLRAKQVEQDVNSSLALSAADPITGHNSWSVGYTYDDNSNILTTTNSRDQTITATYDRLNRLIERNYSDTTPDVSFYYDGTGIGGIPDDSLGKTTKVYSTVSETRYTGFDFMGRVTSSEQRTDGKTYPFQYAYNLAGALVEETYPSGRVIKTTINADGELAQVQSRKNSTAGFFTYADAFSYNAAGAVTKMQLGNGHWETAKYNERQQVTQIGLGVVDDEQNLLKLDFGYTVGPTPVNTPDRNNGSMRSQTITVPAVGSTPGFTVTQTYSYDSLNRLEVAEEKIGGTTTTWKQTFLYDRYGNRKFDAANTTTLGSCPTAVCNPAIPTDSSNRNRFLVNQGSGYTTAYEYDADGSVIKDATGKRYGYDAEGRQNAFFAANNSSGTPTLKYAFDGEGKRVKKFDASSNGYGTTFVYDALGQLVAEYETFDPNSIPEGPIASVSYMTTDHLGSPRIVTDASGAVVSRKDFAAFGDETITSHRTATLGYNIPDIRQDYTGYLKDEESGLEYAQARYYNPQHGRFTSVDPLPASAAIKNPQTFNRYTYALNSPHKFTDPLGLMPGGCGADKSNCDGEAGTGSSNIDGALNRYEDGVAETIKAIALQKKAQDASNRGDYDTMWDLINDSGGLIDTDAELNGNVTTEAFNQAVGSTAMSSTQPSVQQDDVTVTVSAAIDNPLAVDAKGYTYITGTETATYNCMSLGLGVTNTWLQPQAGETLEQFARRNGARRWRLGGRIPRGYTLMKTFEDSADPGNWHVMRRMGPGNWWSKNGGTPVYININNPDTFYRDQYTPSGTVDMKFFLVPRRTLTIPRNPYSTMRF